MSSPASRPLYIFSLFFHSSPPLRPLPSFPTRRSSDLARILDLDRRVQRVAETEVADGSLQQLRFRRRAGRDRKSTCLNSSHVAISYAVFCLKKKKKIKIIKYITSIVKKHTSESISCMY